MYARLLDITTILEHRSVFLLGPRQTGKSTLLAATFPHARFVNLLEADTFRQMSARPESLRQSLRPEEALIVIDEIQKLPSLLDEVHLLIERNKSLRFILTGSSARKLRRTGVNLLAGRAWTRHLHPLVTPEIPHIPLARRLLNGSLPSIVESPSPEQDLREYCGVYLQEEIRAEAFTRSIEAFSRFLTVAALSNTTLINFTKIGLDAQVPPRTIREFFSVLEDTLVGFLLPPFQHGKKRKAVATSKFYFFDVGVAHSLQGTTFLAPQTSAYGRAFEHFIASELRTYLSYRHPQRALTFWRTTSHLEVDFIIDTSIAIEVKAGSRVTERDSQSLQALSQETKLTRKILVSMDPQAKVFDSGVECIPVDEFLTQLWNDKIVGKL
jgi:uncharacterized protein